MIRALYCSQNGHYTTGIHPAQFGQMLQETEGFMWVDFENEPVEVCEPIMLETFKFHPLAVDDALTETHVPRIDDWEAYLYIVLHSITLDGNDSTPICAEEVDLFLGSNYVVSHHDHPIPSINRVWESAQKDERHLKMGADHIVYRIADELVVDYMNVIEDLDDEIDRVEDLVFHRPDNRMLARIFTLKRATLQLRRTISPQREVLNKLARDDYDEIDQKDRVYFRDVYDHLVRLHDITESLRDLVGGALDTYLSVVNNRMNEIMKTLTVITSLFMPISFIAGFFGMNFFVPDPNVPLAEWVSNPVFVFSLLLMIGLPTTMLLIMRRRGWM